LALELRAWNCGLGIAEDASDCDGYGCENVDGAVACRLGGKDRSEVVSGLVSVVLGSMLGGMARYFISGFVARRVGETYPWGTLFINVSGAFLIGIFGALAQDDASVFASPDPWLFAVTGFLGCYTTVSSFSLQSLSLARGGQGGLAASYVVVSVVLCLVAVALGFTLADLYR
jgi:fluoride exporter